MNKERLQNFINFLKTVPEEHFNMRCWQSCSDGQLRSVSEVETICATPEEIVKSCGTTACAAGWLAVSPEFVEAGGKIDYEYGGPIFGGTNDFSDAFSRYFDIPSELGSYLTTDGDFYSPGDDELDLKDVPLKDVIAALEWILETEPMAGVVEVRKELEEELAPIEEKIAKLENELALLNGQRQSIEDKIDRQTNYVEMRREYLKNNS